MHRLDGDQADNGDPGLVLLTLNRGLTLLTQLSNQPPSDHPYTIVVPASYTRMQNLDMQMGYKW